MVFLFIMLIILVGISCMYFAKIKIEIYNLNFSLDFKDKALDKILENIEITVNVLIFKKIKILKLKYNKDKFNKIYKVSNINFEKKDKKNKKIKQNKISNKFNYKMKNLIMQKKENLINKTLKYKAEVIKEIFEFCIKSIYSINLNIEIGTKDAKNTSYAYAILLILLNNVVNHIEVNNDNIVNSNFSRISIQPIFRNENIFNLAFTGIFILRINHIIHIIYMLINKKGVNENERTSNRRTYAYSNE